MKNLFSKLFGKKIESKKIPIIQPRPSQWNKTIDDLIQEMNSGMRKGIEAHELDWAREYSRSLLREGIRYPQKGDVYESLIDQSIMYMTAWMAPFTGGGDGIILKGERIWIDNLPNHEKPIGVYAMPIDYENLERRMVPSEEYLAPNYNGFYLHIEAMTLIDKFTLVETEYKGNVI